MVDLSSPSTFVYASLGQQPTTTRLADNWCFLTFSKQLNIQKHCITIFSEMQGLPFQLNSPCQSYLSPYGFNELAS